MPFINLTLSTSFPIIINTDNILFLKTSVPADAERGINTAIFLVGRIEAIVVKEELKDIMLKLPNNRVG